jgi:signal transduction histidine kinase
LPEHIILCLFNLSMQVAPLPQNETERLAALREYSILDSAPEKEFDELVSLASLICQTPISTVTLIDQNRQWFKARVGLKDSQTSRDSAFCAHAILKEEIMVVSDTLKDDRFFDNPLVTGDPDIRFYAGMPLINPEGFKLGTLCVIDKRPRELSATQLFTLQVLGKQAAKQMELNRKVIELNRLNDFNSKLLSLIGHDLRTPFNSLYGLLELTENYNISLNEFKNIIPKVRDSYTSAYELLSNLMEWANAQFSKGQLRIGNHSLKKMVGEILTVNDSLFKQKKNAVMNLIEPTVQVNADGDMIKAVFRNLILNANKFTADGSIVASAYLAGDKIEVCIADTGKGMEQEQIDKMFSWENRRSTTGTHGERGSGFGLLVCHEFIEKNGGRIWVKSAPGKGSSFYFSLPKGN